MQPSSLVLAPFRIAFLVTLPLTAAAQVTHHKKINDVVGGFAGALGTTDEFGSSVTPIGDVDGDGVVDLAVGARLDRIPENNHGAVWILFMNADGTVHGERRIAEGAGGFTGVLENGDEFGSGVAPLGDLDGDGVPDLAVGAGGFNPSAVRDGTVWILFLHADGTVKSHVEIDDLTAGRRFGRSVSKLGDVNGNGVVDLAVGSIQGFAGSLDRVWILFLNSNGTVASRREIRQSVGGFTGTIDSGDRFGDGVAELGDLDSDGIRDLAVGATGDDDGGTDRGAVWILFLNASGTVRAHQKISATAGGFVGALADSDEFGRGLAGVGDVDGDGVEDLVVGSTRHDDGGPDRGATWLLFLNTNGTVKAHQKISDNSGGFTGTLGDNNKFGTGVCAVGDLDGDNGVELAVGAVDGWSPCHTRGSLWILFTDYGSCGSPSLTGISPASGPFRGGNKVLVHGQCFTSATTVHFDGVPSPSVRYLGSTTLEAIVPERTVPPAVKKIPIPVRVDVSVVDGVQQAVLPNGYRYEVGPERITNRPPRIHASIAQETVVRTWSELSFTLTVEDPEEDPIDLRLINPPPGLVFAPVQDAASPSVHEVRWSVPVRCGGRQRLVFEADDGVAPAKRSRFALDLRVEGRMANVGILEGDVTGDGVLDVVARARFADVGGIADTGAIYVWAGAGAPGGTPTATLTVPGALASDRLGDASGGQAIQLCDVTGDGVLDIVAGAALTDLGGKADVGAIHVWAGGPALTGSLAPLATLSVPGAAASDRLGSTMNSTSQGIQLGDVSGDGVADVVASAASADVGGVVDVGAIYLWRGGAGMTGALSPSATLTVPGAVTGDQLTLLSTTGPGQGLQLADVTGEGVLDVLVGASFADVHGVVNAGAAYLWKGGSGLVGAHAPDVTLTVPGAQTADMLCSCPSNGTHTALLAADLSGDGILDVIAGATIANVAGVSDVGAVYLWAGGASLSGEIAPTATLTVPGAVASDGLGDTTGGQGLQLADLTGDGTLDLVAGASRANVGGVSDAGAIYLWAGGAGLIGSVTPTASLTVPGAVVSDQLGDAERGQGFQLVDVSGDGQLDLVACCIFANVAGVNDTGAIYVWLGGPALAGPSSPHATLTVPGAVASDMLGSITAGSIGGEAMQIADLTGDGVRDILAGAVNANVGGVADTGALYLWAGGSGLTGALAPTATLTVPGAATTDRLGYTGGYSQGLHLVDVTGDGVQDVVAGASFANVGTSDTGAIYLWAGGSGLSGALAPTARLSVPGAFSSDRLGELQIGQGILVCDVTGDGVSDIVAGASNANLTTLTSLTDAGAVYQWTGGPGLSGNVGPQAILTAACSAMSLDQLGYNGNEGGGLGVADVTGDGVLDVVVGCYLADPGSVNAAGAIYLWKGPIDAPAPITSTFTVPGAVASDTLGN